MLSQPVNLLVKIWTRCTYSRNEELLHMYIYSIAVILYYGYNHLTQQKQPLFMYCIQNCMHMWMLTVIDVYWHSQKVTHTEMPTLYQPCTCTCDKVQIYRPCFNLGNGNHDRVVSCLPHAQLFQPSDQPQHNLTCVLRSYNF